jgi:hypothetical protein
MPLWLRRRRAVIFVAFCSVSSSAVDIENEDDDEYDTAAQSPPETPNAKRQTPNALPT